MLPAFNTHDKNQSFASSLLNEIACPQKTQEVSVSEKKIIRIKVKNKTKQNPKGQNKRQSSPCKTKNRYEYLHAFDIACVLRMPRRMHAGVPVCGVFWEFAKPA